MSKHDKQPTCPGLKGLAVRRGIGVLVEGPDDAPNPTAAQRKALEPAITALVEAAVKCGVPLPLRLTLVEGAVAGPPDDLLPPTRN